MKHSALHGDQGSTVNIADPKTGMFLDLSFAPGQMHRTLHVIMNGRLHTVYARLVKIETNDENDLVLAIRAPAAASDAPPVNAKAPPHPATVLRPEHQTRAAREALRNAPHPATVVPPRLSATQPLPPTPAAVEAMRANERGERNRGLVPDWEGATEPVFSDADNAAFEQEKQARTAQRQAEDQGLQGLEPEFIDEDGNGPPPAGTHGATESGPDGQPMGVGAPAGEGALGTPPPPPPPPQRPAAPDPKAAKSGPKGSGRK
jgi:hypothetical protein